MMPISLHCHILHEKHIVIALLTKHSIVHLASLGLQLITTALQQSLYPGAKLDCLQGITQINCKIPKTMSL